MSALKLRYCGSFVKLDGFSLPEWPEVALELRDKTLTHLVMVSDHNEYSSLSQKTKNALLSNFLRTEHVECPDDPLDAWTCIPRGKFE